MVVIRLTRVGKKKQAHYRIVVADSRRAVQGKFISILGWYNPHTKELQVNKDDLKEWFDKGAKPSIALAKLLKKEKVELPKWVKIVEKKKAPKEKGKTEEKKAAPKAEEAPAEGEGTSEESNGEEKAPKEEVKEEKAEETGEIPVKEEKTEEKAEEPTKEEEKAEEPKE